MAKGIMFPFKTNPRGGLKTVEGPELLRQNIVLGVTPASSQHPWNQRLTPREDIIFDIADSALSGELSAHIYDLFEDLQKLQMAMLPRNSKALKVQRGAANSGDMLVSITYVDLEDNKSREIQIKGKK